MILRLEMRNREEHELDAIAKAHDFSAAHFILEEIEVLRDRLRKKNEATPKRAGEDLSEDMVFIAGAIQALNAVIEAPEQARYRNNRRGRQ